MAMKVDVMNNNTLLTVLSFAFVLFVFCLIIRKNTDSINLLLAFSVLAGSIIALLIYSWSELKDIEQKFIIKTQYTIYHDIPKIKRTGVSEVDRTLRRHYEKIVSQLFSVKNSEIFNPKKINISDGIFYYKTNTKIYKDFVMNSLCMFFTNQETDWRKSVASANGQITSLITNHEKRNEDTLIVSRQLFDPSNMFTGVMDAGVGGEIMGMSMNIKMPHKTTIIHPEGLLVIENSFCKITFSTSIASDIHFGDPDIPTQIETLSGGIPRHETRYIDIVVDVVYKGNLAKNKQMANYKNWVNRIIKKLDIWYS